MRLAHFIMTRFNIPGPTKLDQNSKASSEDWCMLRCDTFETISIPSFEDQTNRDFRVIVLCSEEYSTSKIRRRIAGWPKYIKPVFIEGAHPLRYMPMLKDIIRAETDLKKVHTLLTSMCDTDDAFHAKYIERVQKEAKLNVTECLRFSKGCKLDYKTGECFLQESNQFTMYPTLVESCMDGLHRYVRTVLCTKHPRLPYLYSVRELEVSEPYFMRGINTDNVMTRLGRREEASPLGHVSKLKGYLNVGKVWNVRCG